MSEASEERAAALKASKRPFKILFTAAAVAGVWLVAPAMSEHVPWWSPLAKSAPTR